MNNMVKEFAVIQDNTILRVYEVGLPPSSPEESFKDKVTQALTAESISGFDKIEEVPIEAGVTAGSDVRGYEKNWKRKSLFVRFKEGLVEAPTEAYIVDEATDEFREMTDSELVAAGKKELEPYQKLEGDEIVTKTWKERVQDGTNTYEDYLEQMVRPYRNELLNEADLVYCNPERWYAYSDEEKQAWSAYKQALRDFTKQELEVLDDPKEYEWPQKPL